MLIFLQVVLLILQNIHAINLSNVWLFLPLEVFLVAQCALILVLAIVTVLVK